MRRFSIKSMVAALIFFTTGAAYATPVTWSLSGVAFDDGGSATGSFIYDADTNIYSSWSINTTKGSSLNGYRYDSSDNPNVPLLKVESNPFVSSSVAFWNLDVYPNPFALYPYFLLDFVSDLCNAGGTINLELDVPQANNFAGSWECINCGVFRKVTAGAVTAEAVSVPEPGSLALLGLGIAALGFSRRNNVR